MDSKELLQAIFLSAIRRERVPVSVFLVNGIKLQGQIQSFDDEVFVLQNTSSQMIYKHAVATIVPARELEANVFGAVESE